LKTQQKRLYSIERHLLKRIEDILPVESDLMTATELVQVCQRLHTVNLGFAQHLQSIARRANGDEGSTPETHMNICCDTTSDIDGRTSLNRSRADDPNVVLNEAQPVRFSTSGPLLSVLEADYETDATTTPASTMMPKNERAKSANTGQASTPGSSAR
jgi:hypothetical protein